MRIFLEKYFSRSQIVELMYISQSGEISKRRVKILKIQGDSFQGYCFKRNAKRTNDKRKFTSTSKVLSKKINTLRPLERSL